MDALVYVNDEHERTEDCIAVRACYIPPPLKHEKVASGNAAAKRNAEIAIEKARGAAAGENRS